MRRGSILYFLSTTALLLQGYAQVVEPNPTSKITSKRILVLDGPSSSHSNARAAATVQLQTIKEKLGFQMVIGDHNEVDEDYLADFDILIFNYYFRSETASAVFKSAVRIWYESGGKGYIGYHTSGANEPGEWDWYRDYVTSMRYDSHSGGVQHGTMFKTDDLDVLNSPIMEGLPDEFSGTDEWYDFEYGITFEDANVMYNLDESTLEKPLGRPMDPHPMAWYREDDVGSRYFYTGIVHTVAGAESDFFQSLLIRALEWVAGYEEAEVPGCPDPAYREFLETRTSDDQSLCVTLGINDQASVKGDYLNFIRNRNSISVSISNTGGYKAILTKINGEKVQSEKLYNRKKMTLNTSNLDRGIYVWQINRSGKLIGHKMFLVD